jgi:hypothetical protein
VEEKLQAMTHRFNILHGTRGADSLIGLIEACVRLHEILSRFTSNELSAAVSLNHAQLVDSDRARDNANQSALAMFHAMVSDSDH